MTSRKQKIERPLTEVELEIMQVIWDLGNCTIRDVCDKLPKERDLAYTTVATMMKILEQKKVLSSKKVDKAHTYFPLFTRAEYEAMTLKHISENLFRGNPSSIVMRLLSEGDLSEDELKAIQTHIVERLKS